MFLIRRIITVALTLVGSLVSIILLALVNTFSHTGLSGGQVVLYGLIFGIVSGIFAGYLFINYIIRRVRKIIFNRLGNVIGKFGFLRRI